MYTFLSYIWKVLVACNSVMWPSKFFAIRFGGGFNHQEKYERFFKSSKLNHTGKTLMYIYSPGNLLESLFSLSTK